MLMLLVAVMGLSVQSCSKEETKVVNPTKVAYGRGELSTIYYGQKSVMTIITMAASGSQSVTEKEAKAAIFFANAVKTGDDELKSSAALTDSQAVKIYKNAMKSLVSGQGFSGYLPIYRYDEDDNEKEIGRITFTE